MYWNSPLGGDPLFRYRYADEGKHPRAMVLCSGLDLTIGVAHVKEQKSLFGDMATDDGARTDGASATAVSPHDVRARAAARAAELRHHSVVVEI